MSSLGTLARNYFVSKVGTAAPTEPLTSIQTRYWLTLLAASPDTGFKSLEKDWLRKIINDNGNTASGNYLSSLYSQAVEALGGTASKFIGENQRQVYILDI